MKFNSKPHKIEAFKFIGSETKYPNWFIGARTKGKVFVTINDKEKFVEITAPRGSIKGFIDEWICLNSSRTIFVLSPEEMEAGFTEIVDPYA